MTAVNVLLQYNSHAPMSKKRGKKKTALPISARNFNFAGKMLFFFFFSSSSLNVLFFFFLRPTQRSQTMCISYNSSSTQLITTMFSFVYLRSLLRYIQHSPRL